MNEGGMGWMTALELLQKGGPWGLVILAGFSIRHLYFDSRLRERVHAQQIQALNDRIVQTTEKQIALLQTSNESNRQLIAAIAAATEHEED
jgi:hypothetical protein